MPQSKEAESLSLPRDQAAPQTFQTPKSDSATDTTALSVVPTPVSDVPPYSGSRGTSNNFNGPSSNSNNTCQIPWSSSTRSGDRFAQHDSSSSLLWPDSEGLFQSLTSSDALAWDQLMPGLAPAAGLSHGTPYPKHGSTADRSRYDDPAAADDGHRAVQTVNGLLTNTVRNKRTGYSSSLPSLCHGRAIPGMIASTQIQFLMHANTWLPLVAFQRHFVRRAIRINNPLSG